LPLRNNKQTTTNRPSSPPNPSNSRYYSRNFSEAHAALGELLKLQVRPRSASAAPAAR
jgi:hypothetical protein